MAEERRKGAPDRRRSRPVKQEQTADESAGKDQTSPQNPNGSAAFNSEQLDASIRERQQQDRGEVF